MQRGVQYRYSDSRSQLWVGLLEIISTYYCIFSLTNSSIPSANSRSSLSFLSKIGFGISWSYKVVVNEAGDD